MSLHALHHVTVQTADLEATRDFYRDILELEVGFRPDLPFPGYWMYLGGVPVVHIVPRGDAIGGGVSPDTGPFDHFAFLAQDFARVKANLDGKGIKYRENHVARPPIDQLFFPDNNNVMIELNFPQGQAVATRVGKTIATETARTPSPNLPKERVSFAGVGYDEMVARAKSLAPALAERVASAETLRRLPDETERDLHRLGLFRFAQPARVGGAELDFTIYIDVCAEIARVCPATAWNVGNLAAHHWMLAYFPPAAQDEIWDVSPDTLIATSLAFPCGSGRRVAGGFLVSGRWPFSSGVDNSDWNMLAVTVREGDKAVEQRLALLHRSQYEIIDNWYAMGLCGTGSKDVASKDTFVPE